ncbi:unnamed protein product [Prorocentrum cordatum]|uniref:Uncharacterized protein n=1 Tax=Prorocentrum cordatum TaxID=2364126 RepID=A0ABN9TB42_9DINO|nr:unnamed protein product [Polarella glacialis]
MGPPGGASGAAPRAPLRAREGCPAPIQETRADLRECCLVTIRSSSERAEASPRAAISAWPAGGDSPLLVQFPARGGLVTGDAMPPVAFALFFRLESTSVLIAHLV